MPYSSLMLNLDQHYIFPAGGEGLYLVVDEKGNFRENNFQKALAQISIAADKEAASRRGGPNPRNSHLKLRLPCISMTCVFSHKEDGLTCALRWKEKRNHRI